MSPANHQIRLAARPSGLPRATDWSLTTEEVPEPAEGQFAVAVSHLSIDPAMRGWMNAARSYVPPVEIGAVMRAGAVGQVTASAGVRTGSTLTIWTKASGQLTDAPTGVNRPARRYWVAAATASPQASPSSVPWKRARSPRAHTSTSAALS